jgi:hypothetical protein
MSIGFSRVIFNSVKRGMTNYDLDKELRPYHQFRHNLHVVDGGLLQRQAGYSDGTQRKWAGWYICSPPRSDWHGWED